MTNALGHHWSYRYDPAGNLGEARDPISVMLATYTRWGQPHSIIDGNRHTTTYEYDTYGNRVHTIGAATSVITSTYDIVGRGSSYADAKGHTILFGYYGNDNITRITDPKLRDTIFTYHHNNLIICVF